MKRRFARSSSRKRGLSLRPCQSATFASSSAVRSCGGLYVRPRGDTSIGPPLSGVGSSEKGGPTEGTGNRYGRQGGSARKTRSFALNGCEKYPSCLFATSLGSFPSLLLLRRGFGTCIAPTSEKGNSLRDCTRRTQRLCQKWDGEIPGTGIFGGLSETPDSVSR